MRRRGKDEGFHPHPGDPWHPGWCADEEPTDGSEPSGVEEAAPPPGAAAADESPPFALTASPTPGEEAASGPAAVTPRAAEETAEWIETPGVASSPPAAAGPAAGAEAGPPQSLFDWPAGRAAEGEPPGGPASEARPAEPGPEPEHAPPPWSPDEAPAEEGEAAGEAQGEGAEAASDTRPAGMAASEPGPEPEHAPPPWSPDEVEAKGEVAATGGEAEVEDWLAFTSERTGGSTGPATGPERAAGEEAAWAEFADAPLATPRRRFRAFGRRGRGAGEPVQEGPAEAGVDSLDAGERREPQPPPWSPDVPPEGVGPPGAEAGEAAGDAAEVPETLGLPPVEAESVVLSAPGEAGEPTPPPWLIQSELDRAAAIPVIPPVPGEESAGQAASEWESAAAWSEEAPARPAAPAPAETWGLEEEAEAWEEFGGPAAGAGAPTMEIGPPGAPAIPPPAPREFISEQIFAGAVTSEHRDLAAEVAAADSAEAQMQAVSAPMAGLESGVVGFEDVVELEGAGAPEVEPPARSDLPLRVATGLVLVLLLVGAIWVGGGFLAGFIGLLAFAGVVELYAALRRSGYRPLGLFGALGSAGLLAATWYRGLVAVPAVAIAVAVVCFFYYTLASRRRDPLTNGSITLLGMLWVAGTLAFAFPIVVAPNFRVLISALVATVVANDVGAYFAGRSWGSRRLAPVLSPHKTLEGLAGGVVLGVAVAVLIGHFFAPLNLRVGAGLGLVVAVMAPLGDLAESMVKRSLGLKDMGSLLPGHGGILDRIDAFLFVVPAAWVLYETLGLLR